MSCKIHVTMTIRLCFLAGLLGAAAMQDARGDDEGQPPMPRMSKAETVAVEHFAKDMQAVKDWIKAEQDAAAENEARYQRIPVALPERLAKVRAEGLPAALSAPFTALKVAAPATGSVARGTVFGAPPYKITEAELLGTFTSNVAEPLLVAVHLYQTDSSPTAT